MNNIIENKKLKMGNEQLPQGWEMKKLGEILSIERGGSPRPISKYLTDSDDGLNWIKIADATASGKYIYKTKEKITRDGLHKTRLVEIGDFILSNSMSFGRPYIMKTTGCIHDGWLVLRQNETKIFENEFLYYLLSSTYVFNQFNSLAAGSTVRNLNISLVSSVQVPLPPLSEQKRIVSKLDTLFAEIEAIETKTKQNLENTKELFQSYLQAVFDPSTRSGQGSKGDNCGILSSSKWEKKKLGEVCEKNKNISWNTTSEDFEYIDLSSVSRESLTIIKSETINKTNAPSRAKKIILEKDVIFATTRPTLKRVAVVNKNYSNQICSTGFCILRAKHHITMPRWIFYFIQNEHFINRMKSLQRGASYPAVTDSDVKNSSIPLPPLSEQQRIVEKLDSLSSETKKLESLYQEKLLSLSELKKSILDKAFKGEI